MEPPADPIQCVSSVLDELGIVFERFDHPPVFTVDEALVHWAGIQGTHCKNLFLRNNKGARHYLVVVEHSKPVDLKRLASVIGDDRLSFASPERLLKHLGLTPGSVSPFGLINNTAHDVTVVLDAGLAASERVAFHPNTNTATFTLLFADFERFLTWCGNPVKTVHI